MKRILFKIILCGMLVAAPVVIKPIQVPNTSSDEEGAGEECAICLHRKDADQFRRLTNCAHSFCRDCLQRVAGSNNPKECALCRVPWSAADENFDAQPVVEPMGEEEQEMRDCPVCVEERVADQFPQLTCGHNGICVVCLRDQLNPVLNAPNLQDEMRAELRCPNRACRAVGINPQAEPRLMQPGDIRLIYEDPDRPDQAQERVDRFNEVVRLLNLRRENVQNEAAFNLFLEENPQARRCPTEGCQWAYLIEQDQRPANIRCNVCNQQFCSHCRGVHRVGERCRRPEDVVQNNNNNPAELTPEERANREWARENIKACPACNRNIQRTEGCNHMRCQCGHEFCWMCLVPDFGHRHQQCLPADLERAQRLYGRGAGVPSNANDVYGLRYRREPEPAIGLPARGLPIDDVMDQLRRARERREAAEEMLRRARGNLQYNNYGYQPAAYPIGNNNNFYIPGGHAWGVPAEAAPAADAWNQPFVHRRNNNPPPMPPFVKGLLILAAVGAGIGVYKLYQYLTAPKIMPVKDIKISLENLLKEATRDKRLVENGMYVRDAFKKFFVTEEKNNAYGNLNAAQLTALKKIVDELELAFVAGYCEREYLELIHFKIALETNKNVAVSHKPDAVEAPVATKQAQVKKAVAKKQTNRRGRSVNRVK